MDKKEKRIGVLSAWAYTLGCAVGWGSFMNPTNIFLPQAGPLGSAIGIALASVMILFIGKGIAYMAETFPESSGVHVYIVRVLGEDHGFLSAWAMLLAYLSVMWANATAIVMLIRFVMGDLLQFGFYYQVADYDVYFGEILVTMVVMIISALLAIFGRTIVRELHALFAILQVALVVVIFVGILIYGCPSEAGSFGFAQTAVSDGMEIFNIMVLAPWMYVGFEAVTYMIGSGHRQAKGIDKIIACAVVCGMLAYALPMLIPVFALPDGYSRWTDYLADSSQSGGLFGLPVFYSVYNTLGNTGLNILILAILSAIFTSMFGLFRATSRLLCAMAEDGLMPEVFSKKNKNGEPQSAMLLVLLVSLVIPFFGRTAIGWIVDVTTISATIVYVYSSFCTLRLAASDPSAGIMMKIISVVGAVFSAASFLFLLIPNLLSENKLAPESYLILSVWCIVGLIYYWIVFRRDKKDVFGKSTVMWIMMTFLIFFSSVMWVRQRTTKKLAVMIQNDNFLLKFINANALIEILVVVIVLFILLSLFNTLLTRERQKEKRMIESEAKNAAKTVFLSNMSHDIRTPMNAILGFTDLALLDTGNADKMEEYLNKIKASGNHLLSLINDVLEMSRIESGKIDLSPTAVNIREFFSDLDSIMRGQAEAKGQILTVDASGLKNEYVMVDRLRLNQVLFNLSSNAIKYTEEGGTIRIEALQTTGVIDGRASYELRVRDNGMGMTPEFAEKVFEAFERDKDAEMKGIQGTGLGMAITKRIIDMMGGTIRVETSLGEGSEFIVNLTLPIASEKDVAEVHAGEVSIDEVDLSGKRVLLTDDVDINREIAEAVLEMFGLEVDQAVDGQEAYEKVLKNPGGYYDAVLMDVQMPRMNGYEATQAIRSIADDKKSSVPIIAMTANAFEEDIKNARASGMNGHVAKPMDQKKLAAELIKVMGK